MLEKQTLIDSIEITRNGSLQIRQADVFIEDGIEQAKSYHRYVLHPGNDLVGQPDNVVAIANLVWTEEVIAAYLASIPPPLGGGNGEDPGEQ